jgi:Zn-finger nucleic acid-binding protein
MPDLIKCPHCGEAVNPRFTFCPFCNGRVLKATPLKEPVCPRCNRKLTAFNRDEMELCLCPGYHGLWVDSTAFHVLTSETNVYKEETVKEQYSRSAVIEKEDIRYLKCVRCGEVMTRKNYAHISGVIIDECGRHGVWLDAGELEKIRQFIADGGLERAQDREIERNHQELKDLAQRVQTVEFTEKLIHFWDWRRWFFGGMFRKL